MRNIKIVFVCGPFRAPTQWGIEENVRRAERVAIDVWRAGAMAMCPHSNSKLFHGEATDQIFLDGYLEMIRRCDAVITVVGLEKSSGSRLEVAHAHACGIPVFDGMRALSHWIGGSPDREREAEKEVQHDG
ncbi:MAG: DUF4406 domain-containing protein [Candidatus Paceibacterota bacterium]